MWTFALVVCGALILTDAKECDHATEVHTMVGLCYLGIDSEFSEIMTGMQSLLDDESISQSDLRSLTANICTISIWVRYCLAQGLADCSNFDTEIVPLEGEDLMCNRNGSVSVGLKNLVDRFSNFNINGECSSATLSMFRNCQQNQTRLSQVLTKDIPKRLGKNVQGTLACVAKKIEDTDVSTCGRKSDMMTIAFLYQYVAGGAFLVLPFNFSEYSTVGQRENLAWFRTFLRR
ncbi:hypothetical protein ScPMuIL_000959 [Solemya velum]